MPVDREETLKKAEKLLRQGRLDAAIAEYVRIVDENPRDWTTTNTLGDLYVRAGQSDKAAAQYTKIADHLMNEGFYPKAAAIYKKILKIKPDEEASQLNLAEISAKQGLLADAKSYLTSVAERRRARGDRMGATEIIVKLGSVDPGDFDARLAAARVLAESGDAIAAAMRYRELHADLAEKGRAAEARAALREAVRLNHDDLDGRAELAKAAVADGDLETAKAYLDRSIAGSDPALLMALMEIHLRTRQMDTARELLHEIFRIDSGLRGAVVDLAWQLAESSPEAAFVCIDTAVDAELGAGNHMDAAALLQEFVTRVPGQISSLLKLVEICVDGGLEAAMYETQAQLADAYLERGQAAEARVIAEDLVAREPWEHAHIERFRRSLVMLNVPDPDQLIAERLSGQGPFVATDPFMPPEPLIPVAEQPAAKEPPPPKVAPPPPAPPPAAPVVEAPPQAPPAAAPKAPEGKKKKKDMEIDLTSVLEELQGMMSAPTPVEPPPPRQNLEEVFQDMRDGALRETGGDEAEEQLKLAHTYLDMGMVEEGARALATAARSPRHRFEAASTLGRLYLKRSDLAHAIEWLERAAEAPAPGVEEGRALLYDLGAALESAGETARALAVFLELQADAGDYRDVAQRADRLARVQTGG